MVKASLRTAKTAPPVVDVSASVTTVGTGTGKPETIAAPGTETLESMVPQQPPVDNAHIEPGCEKFSEPAAAPQTTALAPRPANTAIAVPRNQDLADEGFAGDWGADDVKFPQLKQVQGSGPLSQLFDNGTIVLGEDELMPAPSVKPDAKNTPLVFVPLYIQKQFREKLSQELVDQGEMPRIFDTIAEVEAAGLTTRWVGNTMPDNYAEPSSKQLLLIQKPEGSEHPGFALEFGEKQWALALFYAAGGAYRNTAKVIFNNRDTTLLVPVLENGQPKKTEKGVVVKKPLLYKFPWEMSFRRVKAGNFTPWRPFLKCLTKHETTPEMREFIDGVLKGNGFTQSTATE